jgi:DNA-directed RNA polymerase subunit N
MYFPIRCFTCGAPIAHKWEDYEAKIKAGVKAADALNELGVERYCCRRMFLSHVNVMDKIVKYPRL